MSQEQESKQPEEQQITIPLRWGDSSQIPTVYANHVLITHSGGEFYLVFGELVPINIDKDDPPDFLEIKPVAKIALMPDNMLRLAEIIQNNVDNYRKSFMTHANDEGDQS